MIVVLTLSQLPAAVSSCELEASASTIQHQLAARAVLSIEPPHQRVVGGIARAGSASHHPVVADVDFADGSLSTETLFPVVYDELKRIARHHLRTNEPATLSTTELVHETFLKLSKGADVSWEGRAHFFGAASRAMRQVMVDFARRRRAAKRGSQPTLVSLNDAEGALNVELDGVLALDDALEQLDRVDSRLRQVVELRFFCGLSEHDIARVLSVGVRTVERDWFKARLFLLRELGTSTQ